MTLTEAEAKMKWCPVARPVRTDSANRNADGAPTTAAFCIASQCMAWQWEKGADVMKYDAECKGACGLAGVPQ